NDLYHKGQHLYGGDLARAHAAREGQVIVCEGYTDTIALHQAGMRNAVGLMGTALTADQVGELARMAQTVLLALDADSSGQEAMLRASTLAAKRKLELRVVAMPAGTDPAEIVHNDGAEAMAALVDAEGSAQAEGGERGGTESAAATALSRREHTERAFLALCIASPEDGTRALAELDLEESFSSERLRGAARFLRAGDLRDPMHGGPSGEAAGAGAELQPDPELKALLAELVV